jgi:hypothetical protein
MIEPYFYRSSNFQNWFTCENFDPFVYVGCHHVTPISCDFHNAVRSTGSSPKSGDRLTS